MRDPLLTRCDHARRKDFSGSSRIMTVNIPFAPSISQIDIRSDIYIPIPPETAERVPANSQMS